MIYHKHTKDIDTITPVVSKLKKLPLYVLCYLVGSYHFDVQVGIFSFGILILFDFLFCIYIYHFTYIIETYVRMHGFTARLANLTFNKIYLDIVSVLYRTFHSVVYVDIVHDVMTCSMLSPRISTQDLFGTDSCTVSSASSSCACAST